MEHIVSNIIDVICTENEEMHHYAPEKMEPAIHYPPTQYQTYLSC